MKNVRFSSLVCVALAALFLGSQMPASSTVAQDDAKAKPAAKAEKKAPKKAKGRVPPYFAQVGLSGEQRETIYTVQAEYNGKIGDLKKQIADLTAKRDTEVEAVLTETQKKQLDDLRATAKKKADERKKKK
jgi:hypothetical protein